MWEQYELISVEYLVQCVAPHKAQQALSIIPLLIIFIVIIPLLQL